MSSFWVGFAKGLGGLHQRTGEQELSFAKLCRESSTAGQWLSLLQAMVGTMKTSMGILARDSLSAVRSGTNALEEEKNSLKGDSLLETNCFIPQIVQNHL